MTQPQKTKSRSGSKPGMHHGPGSSKLNSHWPFIKEARRQNTPFREIIKWLRVKHGLNVSLGTLKPYHKRRMAEDDRAFFAPIEIAGVDQRSDIPRYPARGDANADTDPFEAARKQAEVNNNNNKNQNRSKKIDETAVYT